ncbi:MAG: hypothetical protein ABFR32_10525 [Bacteroidota bacterium]
MKKSINYLCFIVTFLFFSNTAYSQYTKWETDVTYNDIEFKKIRFKIQETDTTYAEGILKQNTIVEGYPCHKKIVFTRNWKLRQFLLAENHFMLGAEFPKESRIIFGKDHISCFLGKDTQINGYLCNGNYAKWYSTGISTSFYPSGKLKCFYPDDDVEINNILCKSSPFAGVCLHENGNLKQCKLTKDEIINGKEYKKNTELIFDETGLVISEK